MAINEKYSFGDFTGQDFSDIDASEFNNTEIVGSCFYQELPIDYTGNPHGKAIFPSTMTGVVFKRCNLDNVRVIGTNSIDGGCNRNIRVQNDLEDWVVDSAGNPIEPSGKARFQSLGLSIDPQDLPAQARSNGKSITQETEENL
jgi:hypothetical protein